MVMGTRRELLAVLELNSARRAGLVTERTRRSLRSCQRRRVEAREPEELVCLDSFCVGGLKGVGKVWQLTGNALCESFFATLECELIDRQSFRSRDGARRAVFEFIEG
jgi:hypothetical protein